MSEQIGRFRILKRLGGGGFGEVFLGEDPGIGRQVAIKVFRPKDENLIAFATSSDDEGLQVLRSRFLNEAKILATLEDEPHIVNVLEYGEQPDGTPYYVMPYLPHSLADELGKDIFDVAALSELPADQHPRALPLARALDAVEQTLKGLAAAHARGLIHRDIKPSNLMLSQSGQLRVVDFGIAKAPDGQHSTVSHLGMGSRNYMAPEQRESAKHVDARADLYAVGAVAYRALTGRLPIGRFPDPNVAVPALGKPMNDLILQLLAQDKADRPKDAGEALALFQKARTSVGQASEERTDTWVGESAEAGLRDELRPLKAKIVELLSAQGRIAQADWPKLKALAAIGDLDETELREWIEALASRDKALAAKRKLADLIHAQVRQRGAALPDAALADFEDAAMAVGWDRTQLQAIAAQAADEVVPVPRPAAEPAKAPPSPPRVERRPLPLRKLAMALGLAVAVAGIGWGLVAWRQGQIEEAAQIAAAALAETEARQQQEAEAQLRQLQRHLEQLGYSLSVTGQMDNVTKRAIEKFESDEGLPVTGEPSPTLTEAAAGAYARRDDAAWASAEQADTEASYQAYAEAWPQGRHQSRLVAKLGATRERAVQQADENAWATATQADTEAAYRAYQRAQPNGQHLAELPARIEAAKTKAAELARLAEEQRKAEEERRAPGARFRDCDGCPDLVVIPAGRFQQGSPDTEAGRNSNEGPVRTVNVPSFALGRTEVTRGEFRRFVEATGHTTDAEKNAGGNAGCYAYKGGSDFGWTASTSWRNSGFAQDDSHPVVCVSWNDAKAYVDWLRKTTGKAYRLPSESELEYVNRAGKTTPWPWGSDGHAGCGMANYGDATMKGGISGWKWNAASCADGHVFTAPVARLRANAFGLHDTAGNVWEWAEDCWNGSYADAPRDGRPWNAGDCGRRVLRGGSWRNGPDWVRSAFRSGSTPSDRGDTVGFRLARTL